VLNKIFPLVFLSIVLLQSCSKSSDFTSSDSFPFDWMINDTFEILGSTKRSTEHSLRNLRICALGIADDANFGLTKAGFYADYETTLTSTSFSFAAIDSIRLIIPISSKLGPMDQSLDLAVYELTERIVATKADSFIEYAYNNTPIGQKSNIIVNSKDSILDGSFKIGPSVTIPLNISFANKLIAKGSYASQEELKTVFNGLFVVPTSSTPTNGMAIIQLSSSNKIKIYGKNNAGQSIISEFITGGTNSTTVNYSKNSYNGTAETMINQPSSSQNNFYLMGTRGYYGELNIPNINAFIKNNNIFKAELELTVSDTGFFTPKIGLVYYDSIKKTEQSLDDYYINPSKFMPGVQNINGTRKFVFNISYFINKMASQNSAFTLRIYSNEIEDNSFLKFNFSKLYPNRIVIAGNNQANKPKLKLYYVKK
jgi:hypothetical protein